MTTSNSPLTSSLMKSTRTRKPLSRGKTAYYPQTVRAIALVLEDESRLLNVTEEIYEVVALQTRCHPSNVERNIRTVVLCAWHTNRPLLVKMAGFTLTAPPRASQFIDIIASYIQREVLSDPNRRVLI